MNNQGRRFARLLWLYGEITTKGPVTFRQITDDWKNASLNDMGEQLAHKTFENHRKDVEDLFDISIECNRADNTYFIAERLDLAKATQDMLNGALLFNKFKSDARLSCLIRPEQKSGEDTSKLFIVTDAISEEHELRILYRHNYDRLREKEYTIKPIAVKQFRNRWYIVGELEKGDTYSFSLDRLLTISKGNKTAPSQYDVDEMFADAFGIIREDKVKPEEITIQVEAEQANYFRALPLHSSQEVVSETEAEVVFKLKLAPTYDFIMELLSHGPKIEVITPASLRAKIAALIVQMSDIYK